MESGRFSVKEALGYGWQKTKENLGFFAKALFFIFLIIHVPSFIMNMFGNMEKKGAIQLPAAVTVIFLIISIILWVLSRIIEMGLLKISLNIHDNQKVKVFDIFSYWRMFFQYVVGSFCYLLAVAGGFVLLIIPGVILAVRMGLFPYFIVEEKMGPIASLKRSFEITKPCFKELFLLDVLSVFIMLAGLLLLFIGLIFAIPVCYLAYAWVYRSLTKEISKEA